MLKGIGEPEMTIGMVIFIGGLLFAFGIIFMKFTYVSTVVKSNEADYILVNEARAAMSCFSGSGGVMDPSKINEASKRACKIEAEVCVRDMSTGREWLDCSERKMMRIRMYGPIASGSDIRMGEISVREA
jgi:hypothetical protein